MNYAILKLDGKTFMIHEALGMTGIWQDKKGSMFFHPEAAMQDELYAYFHEIGQPADNEKINNLLKQMEYFKKEINESQA